MRMGLANASHFRCNASKASRPERPRSRRKMSLFKISSRLAAALVCCTCTAVHAQRPDQLFPLRGAPATGPIVSVSRTEVVLRVRGAEQKFSVLDIKRLIPGEEPRELTAARDAVLNGQFEKGL